MRKTAIALMLTTFLFSINAQEVDTIVNATQDKGLLFSNAQSWAVQTKPYLNKEIILSDYNLGRVMIKSTSKVNRDNISSLKMIGYSLEGKLTLDSKDKAYRLRIESPAILIDVNPPTTISRMSTKQLLAYKDELELIKGVVVDDGLLNGLIYWNVGDLIAKKNLLHGDLLDLNSRPKPSKKKIKDLERKLDIINEMLNTWNEFSLYLRESIMDTMSENDAF